MLSPGQIDRPAFVLIDGHLEGRQFLPETRLDGLEEPIMLRIGVHQNHEIVSKPGIFEVGVGPTAGDLFGPLQHPIHCSEIQIPEERREYTSYKVANFLVEFSTSIPRTQLRPGYGDGFLGAPLQMRQALEDPTPREQGEQRGSSSTQTQQNSGGAPHV